MQVYKKSCDSYDYVFTIKSYYMQRLEYITLQRNLYTSKKCKERENEEIRRQKKEFMTNND